MKDVCGKRGVMLGVFTTWCFLPDGHEGPCRGAPSSRPLPPPNHGPNRKDPKS